MKKVILALCLVLLVGCHSVDNPSQQLQQKIDLALSLPSGHANNHKSYYSYYTEPSVGVVETTVTSSLLKYGNTDFVMNLAINKIVNARSYGDVIPQSINLDDQYLISNLTGTYCDYDGSEYEFIVKLYQLSDIYYLSLDTQYVNFYSNGSLQEMIDILKPMLMIAKTVQINEDMIMLDYSAKERISFKGEKLQLYDEVIPQQGTMQEMMDLVDKPQFTDAPSFEDDQWQHDNYE